MNELLIELLEISKQLDEANLGEFDFGRLKEALIRLERQAPEFCRIQKEHKILKDYLILQVRGKARALRIVKKDRSGYGWEGYPGSDYDPDAEKLIEIYRNLKRELNFYLGSRPHYRPVCARANHAKDNVDYKIGG